MATDLTFVEYIVDQARLGARLTHRKMFGEYALYIGTKVVALACDNNLFIKPTPATDALTANLPRRSPYPGARPHVAANALLDEPDLLSELLLATENALPRPKPKAAKKRKA